MRSMPPTGQKLWGQDLGGAIGGGVITYTANGAQKVAVAAGFTNVAWPTKIVTRQGRRARPRQRRGEQVRSLPPVIAAYTIGVSWVFRGKIGKVASKP